MSRGHFQENATFCFDCASCVQRWYMMPRDKAILKGHHNFPFYSSRTVLYRVLFNNIVAFVGLVCSCHFTRSVKYLEHIIQEEVSTALQFIFFVMCVPAKVHHYAHLKYTTQKKFRITYYIIFVHTILNSHSYAWRERNCMKLSRLHQWACESTSTNFQDDLTASLENPKNRIFPKILR